MKRTEMVDYERACREFVWDIPATFNFGGDVVDAWAEDPTRLALIWCNPEANEHPGMPECPVPRTEEGVREWLCESIFRR